MSEYAPKKLTVTPVAEKFVHVLTVEISESGAERLKKWETEVYAKAVEKQKAEVAAGADKSIMHEIMWEEGLPYEGAIGGGFTWHITPTSLGDVVKVDYSYTGDSIDLTEYSTW